MNQLFYGDNLRILRNDIRDESVDLIYLDPPFNSNRSYNVLFQHKSGDEAQAQIEAFDDTWTWSQEAAAEYDEMVNGGAPTRVADALIAMRRLLDENDVLAYLVMMTVRLVELHRVLKPNGSLYLHCDDTASHYLKVMLDAIFGPRNFHNEIIWKRTSGHSDARRYGRVHDVILFYAKGDQPTWNEVYQPYDPAYVEQYYRYRDADGRRFMSGDLSAAGLSGGGYTYEWKNVTRVWRVPVETMERLDAEGRVFYTRNGIPRMKRYLDEAKGMPAQDLWTDVEALRSWHQEKMGYPTQKPVPLLERLILASSNPGDVVMDPFCGCGTAIDAAHKLERNWIGIDVTFLSIGLIQDRLRRTYGDEVRATYEVRGVPKDVEGAQAMWNANHFEFERWAVTMLGGHPNEKQVGDRGSDGVIRFHLNDKDQGAIQVSVKGGRQINPGMVRDLRGTVERTKAEMGVLVLMVPPTKGMTEEAQHSGSFDYEFSGATFPKIQIITVPEILKGKRPTMPTPISPFARKAKRRSGQLGLLGDL